MERGGILRETEAKLLEMKNTSELMLDLAYSALIYNHRAIAEEVVDLENRIDYLYEEVQRNSLNRYKETGNYDRALIFMKVADAVERIADAALDIADVVLRDIEVHPVLRQSLEDADIIMLKKQVQAGSMLDERSLGQVKLASETGLWVIAIKRGNKWIYGPNEKTIVRKGDILFARGPVDSENILDAWTTVK